MGNLATSHNTSLANTEKKSGHSGLSNSKEKSPFSQTGIIERDLDSDNIFSSTEPSIKEQMELSRAGYMKVGHSLASNWANSHGDRGTLENDYIQPYLATHKDNLYSFAQPKEQPTVSPNDMEAYTNWQNPNYWDKYHSKINSYDIVEVAYTNDQLVALNNTPDFLNRSWMNIEGGAGDFDLIVVVPGKGKLKDIDLNTPNTNDPTDGQNHFFQITLHCSFIGKNTELDLKKVVEYGVGNYWYPAKDVRTLDGPPMRGKKTPYDYLFEEVIQMTPLDYNKIDSPDFNITQESGEYEWTGVKENFMSDENIVTLDQRWSEKRAFEALVKQLYDRVHLNERLDIYAKYYNLIAKEKTLSNIRDLEAQFIQEMELYYLKARMAWLESIVIAEKANEKEDAEFNDWQTREEEYLQNKKEYDYKFKYKNWSKEKHEKKLAQANAQRVLQGPESVEGWKQSIHSEESEFFHQFANRVTISEKGDTKLPYEDAEYSFDPELFKLILARIPETNENK